MLSFFTWGCTVRVFVAHQVEYSPDLAFSISILCECDMFFRRIDGHTLVALYIIHASCQCIIPLGYYDSFTGNRIDQQ